MTLQVTQIPITPFFGKLRWQNNCSTLVFKADCLQRRASST